MSGKTYTLELTAEEVEAFSLPMNARATVASLTAKVDAALADVRADRERDDLRLPWRAHDGGHGNWYVVMRDGVSVIGAERAAKLMAAAPELLEAVKAMKEWIGFEMCPVRPLIARALRKVETGQVEEP